MEAIMNVFDLQNIFPNEHDTTNLESWSFPKLSKIDKRGKKRIWQIAYFDGKLYTLAGFDTAPKIYESDVETKGKRNYSQQAFQDAKALYNKKINDYYIIEDTEYNEKREINFVKQPMLANEYYYDPETGKSNITEFPVIVQPKLDGIRLLVYLDNDELVMASRRSKNLNYSEKHFTGMKKELDIFLSILPEGTQLDGELYSKDIKFTKITSIVKTKNMVHPDINLIKYYIFDIVLQHNLPFDERFEVLLDSYEHLKTLIEIKYLFITESELVETHEEIEQQFRKFRNRGYEGLIIRKIGPGTEYVSSRSNNLLKYKEDYEEEIIVTDILECKGNEKGLCKIVGILPNGKQVTTRPAENFETRRKYLKEKDKLIGKQYTIIFNEINPDTGIPRFPRGKGFRDYE